MVLVTQDMVLVTDMDTISLERDLLMLNPKANHGWDTVLVTVMVVMVLVTQDMVLVTDMDTISLERDLLMLNPKANHGWLDMVLDTVVMVSVTEDMLDTAAMVSVMADLDMFGKINHQNRIKTMAKI